MEYGLLYIIPDENQILGECFFRKVSSNHLSGMQEFIEKYQLNYQFSNEDYQNAPCILAKDGHMIVKTVDNAGILVMYLPEFVTDNQCMWIYENKSLLQKYSMVGAYYVKEKDNSYELDKIHGVDSILNCVNCSNILYQGKVLNSKRAL